MAHRRKVHQRKTTHHRRRRRSSMHGVSGMATNALAVIAGGIIANIGANMIATNQVGGTYAKYIAAAVPIGVGLYMPRLIKGNIGANVGTGMIAVGGVKLFQGLGVISGVTVAGRPAIAGTKTVAGLSTHKAALLAS